MYVIAIYSAYKAFEPVSFQEIHYDSLALMLYLEKNSSEINIPPSTKI